MKTKFISVLLMLVMVISLMPVTAGAQTNGTCGASANWSLTDGTLTISGSGDMFDYDWSNTPPWYSQRDLITSAVIGDGITGIGDLAFNGCVNLLNVSIPETVVKIGSWSFDSCGSLSELNIPENVESIGKMAFWSCSGLTGELKLPDSITEIGAYAFMNCSGVTKVILPNKLTVLNNGVFAGCKSLVDIVIPDTVTSMTETFTECTSLTKLPTLPKNLKSIGDFSFSYCTGITSLDIPEHIESIGSGAFQGCTGLTEIVIPENIKSIDSEAFAQCENVVRAVIPGSVQSIGSRVFTSCGSLSQVDLPDNLTAITDFMFYYCDSLEKIEIPESVTSIGQYAFSNCTVLEGINIPKGVTAIPEHAFYACKALKNIVLPEGVTEVGSNAFYECSSLSEISIPADVKTIGTNAFYNCTALTDVYYGGGESEWSTISISANGNNPLKNANIHYNYGKIGEGTYGDGIKWFIDEKGILTVSGTGNIPDCEISAIDVIYAPWYEHRERISAIKIERGITSIGNEAFRDCLFAESVDIPDTVIRIGEYAFANCSAITEITVPDSVTSIGWFAFSGCTDLEKIKLSENLTAIDRGTFADCQKLSFISIPKSVKEIKKRAFMACPSLKFVTLHSEIIVIESFAFEEVTDVFYAGSRAEWEQMTANSECPVPENATIHYNHAYGDVIACGTYNTTVEWFVDCLGNLVIGGTGGIFSEPWESLKKSIKNIVIGDGITEIYGTCFQQYNMVKTLTIGKNVKNFGRTSVSFSEMYDLETVYWNAVEAEGLLFGGEFFTAFLKNSGSNNGGISIIFGEDVEVIPNCFTRANVKKIVIPSGVNKIDADGNLRVKEIYLPDLTTWCNMEFVQGYSPSNGAKFYVNNMLVTDIVIPDGVTSIPDKAFYEASGIESVIISDTVKEMGDYTFCGCTSLKNVEIGNGVEHVGASAFYGCTSLSNVELGTNITSISDSAFVGCNMITGIVLPDSVASIGDSAFYGCSNLAQISFSENMKEIGDRAFSNCNALTKVYYGGNVFDWDEITIGDFNHSLTNAERYYTNTELITGHGECGDNLKWILTDSGTLTVSGTGDMYGYSGGQGAPWGKEGIKKLVIEGGVTSVGDGAFYDCYDLESVIIPDSVKEIGYQAFCFCEKLTELSIGKGVEELGESAFSWCSSLTSVTIPGNIKTMTYNAFSYCDKLKTVVIEEGVPYIYNDAFIYCTSLEEVTIPVSVKLVGTAAFGYCTALSKVNYAGTKDDWNSISIESGNNSLIAAYENNSIYEGDGKCGDNLEWTLENGVLTISGTGDMYDYDISDVALPWYEIGDSITKIVIEDGVTGIGAYTFWLCFNLKEVVISSDVAEIRTYAFGNCDKMTDVYYMGSKEGWNNITFANLNPYIKNAKLHCLEHELNLELEDNKILINSEKRVDDAIIYVALYNEKGTMLGVDYVKVDIAKSINTIPSPIDDYSGAVTVKVLGWKEFSMLEPIFKATEIKNQ